MFYQVNIFLGVDPSGSTVVNVDVNYNGSSSTYQGQQAIDYLTSLGFSLVDSSSVSFPSGFTPPVNYIVLDVSNFNPNLDVFEIYGSVFFVLNGSLVGSPDSSDFHFYYKDLSVFGYDWQDIFISKSPNVDYSALVSDVLATSFVETSLNGSNGAKYKDGDIVQIQGFPSQYEILASQYITNNENTGTIMYKVKDVNTGSIHYIPQVFILGVV